MLENVHTDLHGFLHVIGDTYYTRGLHNTMSPVCRPLYVVHVIQLTPLVGMNREGSGTPSFRLLTICVTKRWFRGGCNHCHVFSPLNQIYSSIKFSAVSSIICFNNLHSQFQKKKSNTYREKCSSNEGVILYHLHSTYISGE